MIALYKGRSLVSTAIKWITWGEYSHASWITAEQGEYESWQRCGVVYNDLWGIQHTPGTVVDLFDFKTTITNTQRLTIETFLQAQVGKKYDWSGVAAFLPFIRLFKGHNKNKWFCSEYIAEACKHAGVELYEKDSYKVSPTDIAFCALLKEVGTWTVPDRPSLTLAIT